MNIKVFVFILTSFILFLVFSFFLIKKPEFLLCVINESFFMRYIFFWCLFERVHLTHEREWKKCKKLVLLQIFSFIATTPRYSVSFEEVNSVKLFPINKNYQEIHKCAQKNITMLNLR